MNRAIDSTEQFFRDCKIPMSLSEIRIDSTNFEKMASKAVSNVYLLHAYILLDENDIIKILQESL